MQEEKFFEYKEDIIKDDNFIYGTKIDKDEDFGRLYTSCPICKKIAWCDRKDRIYLNTIFSIAYCTECGFVRYENKKM